MKYLLNKLPVKTTNNFKINELEIDLELPTKYEFNNFDIKNGDGLEITQNIVDDNLSSKIGLSFSKYLEVNINVPKNYINDKCVLLEYDFSSGNGEIIHHTGIVRNHHLRTLHQFLNIIMSGIRQLNRSRHLRKIL